MIEQMQVQLDQAQKETDKVKADLETSKNKEKGLEQTITMLNSQFAMMGQ